MKKSKKTPALDYCMMQSENGHTGYLPTAGQLRIIYKYIDLINTVLKHIGSKSL